MIRARALPLFLALSLAAHAALFVAWQAGRTREATEHGAPALGDGALTVSFNGHQAPAARRSEPPRQDTGRTNATPVATTVRAPDRLTVTDGGAATEKTRDTSPSAAAHNHLLGKVRTEFARHFRYPPLARERGWEGQVVLGFSLQADGHLDRIHIARSSGYHVLDESARAALRQVGMVADARQWLNGHAVDMQLPVIYRLLDR